MRKVLLILLIAGCQSVSTNQKLVEKDGFIEVEDTKGQHTILFSMREDGFEFDKLILTTDQEFIPEEWSSSAWATTQIHPKENMWFGTSF